MTDKELRSGLELVYLVCPVRNPTPEETSWLNGYVRGLECGGYGVHYPPRDVNQEDAIGLRILEEHREAMKKSGVVHAYWNGRSQGSFFDVGMAFMAEMPFLIVENTSSGYRLEDEDFFVFKYSGNVKIEGVDEQRVDEIYNAMVEKRQAIRDAEAISFKFEGVSKKALLGLGMAFMAQKRIMLGNREEVEKQRTAGKSFQNTLLELDSRARAGR